MFCKMSKTIAWLRIIAIHYNEKPKELTIYLVNTCVGKVS
jgi:hypothetical protein